MRDINEVTAEVFRRSNNRIKERKQNRNRIIMCCIPLLLCITVFSVVMLPGMMPAKDSAPQKDEGAWGSDGAINDAGDKDGAINDAGDKDGAQMPDISYNFVFNGKEYTMFGSLYEKRFPITNELTNPAFVGSYFVDESHIGDYMGIVTADKNFDEGKLYHYNAYPDSDEIVILYREGLYRLYVASNIKIN